MNLIISSRYEKCKDTIIEDSMFKCIELLKTTNFKFVIFDIDSPICAKHFIIRVSELTLFKDTTFFLCGDIKDKVSYMSLGYLILEKQQKWMTTVSDLSAFDEETIAA